MLIIVFNATFQIININIFVFLNNILRCSSKSARYDFIVTLFLTGTCMSCLKKVLSSSYNYDYNPMRNVQIWQVTKYLFAYCTIQRRISRVFLLSPGNVNTYLKKLINEVVCWFRFLFIKMLKWKRIRYLQTADKVDSS